MDKQEISVRAVFDQVVEIESPQEREAYLDEACAEDGEIRRKVNDLLKAHEEAGSFLKSPPPAVAVTIAQPSITEGPGTTIGPYKLLHQIGEGGMGVVFMAEQTEPVERRVALKVIKPGMDTKQVIARFEAERQVVAMMDHPNIAKVLDAGTTDSGRPYFVMELVKGIPITQYCDERHMTPRERLDLFLPVCHAVQHAHQKGIIHRDIKPSNVLIAEYDDDPVPKIIDFGVSKALNQKLTERTMFTQLGQIVGTLEYMSPEQAKLNQWDIDTRSDVYSLGVLLYELLAGATPFDKARLQSKAFDEVLRIIREEEPPKPSTRISTLGEDVTKVSESRRTSPGGLHQAVRGDLDWLVMKALAKERTRRYQTASNLASDIERYLAGDPIEARPPSMAYRLRKAASRHRAALVTTAVVMFALIAGTVTSTWLAILMNRERNSAVLAREEAEQAKDEAIRQAEIAKEAQEELQLALSGLWEELGDRALDATFSGDYQETQDAIKRLELAKGPRDLIETLHGLALFFDGRHSEAIDHLERAIAQDADSLIALSALSWVCNHSGHQGRREEADKRVRQLSLGPSEKPYEELFLCLNQFVGGSKIDLTATNDRLDDLIAKRGRWGAAYAIRAHTRMELAMETKSLEDFRLAIADFETAQSLLPESPFVRSIGLYVLTTAIALAKHQGIDSTELSTQADQIAAEFSQRSAPLLARARATHHYYLTGQESRAKEVEEGVVQDFVDMLERTGVRFGRALSSDLEASLREDTESVESRSSLALVLVEKSVEGREEALKIVRDIQSEDLPPVYYCIALDVCFLLGKPEEAHAMIQRLKLQSLLSRDWRWWTYVTDYYANDVSEADLIERAQPFNNSRCMAYYAIALKSLALGDRSKAREYLKMTEETRMVGWYNYHWSQALLRRMEGDPNWPDWIPRSQPE